MDKKAPSLALEGARVPLEGPTLRLEGRTRGEKSGIDGRLRGNVGRCAGTHGRFRGKDGPWKRNDGGLRGVGGASNARHATLPWCPWIKEKMAMRDSIVASARRGGIWLMLLAASASAEAGPPPPAPSAEARSQVLAALSEELSKVMPADAQIWMFAVGDADGDGDEEVAVALNVDDAHQARPLLLLRRNADGRLQRVFESPRAIPCHECGGMAGDPLGDVRIETGVIMLHFAGGSRELWESHFIFTHLPARDDWRLTRVTHRGFDMVVRRNAERTLSAEEIGEVSLASFDASQFPADALR